VRLDGPAADLVHGLKYEGWAEAACEMGDRMAQTLIRHPTYGTGGEREGRPAILVPVPTTARREKRRGFNQAFLLARRIAEVTRMPLVEALSRRDARGSQTSLTPSERAENVRGAFVVTPAGSMAIRGADVVIVDDVLTTGATAGEAADTLDSAGARVVTLLAFARSTPDRPGKRP